MAPLLEDIMKEELKERGLNAQRKTVDGIFEFAQCMVDLKEECGKVQGGSTYTNEAQREWGINDSACSMWIKIQEKELLFYKKEVLPSSYQSIYGLSTLSEEDFKSGIESGVINPGMSQADVTAYKKLVKPATTKKSPAKPAKVKVVDILVDAYAMVSPELLKLTGGSHLSARFADLFDNGKVPSSVAKEEAPSIIEKFDEVYQVYFKRELDAEDNAAILLSDSDSEKLDRYKKKLDRELMAEKCNVRHTFLIDSVQSLSLDVDTVLSLVDSQKPVFTATEYKRLLGFFHPDKLPEDLKVNGQVLFNLVQTHRERLCGLDKKTRAGIEKLPGSVEDLMSRRK